MNARHRGTSRPAVIAVGLALAAVAAVAPTATAGGTAPHNEQVALVTESHVQPAAKSYLNGTAQVASYDGSAVVFSTDAALVPWDTNGSEDVYFRYTPEDMSILVSTHGGKAGNDASFEPTISDDGRYVAFTTAATDLVKGKDLNKHGLDVMVRDMHAGKTQRVSVTSAGFQREQNSFFPVISGNGRHVSFQTFGAFGRKDDDHREDVYVRDLKKGTTRQASLLPGAGPDVRESVLNGDISDNGRLVVFGNDQMLWVRDMVAGETTRFHHEPAEAPCSEFPAGSSGRPVISGNGQYVAFSSCASDLPGGHDVTNIYRMSLATGAVEALTDGNDFSYLPSLSRNGRYLGFGSDASDLVKGDTEGMPDAFRLDVNTGEVQRASQATDGTGGNSWSATTAAAINGDGHSLAYTSYASNLVDDDEFDFEEVFVWRD